MYKGYQSISGDETFINEYMCNMDFSEWFPNEYLLIHNTSTGTQSEMRFNGTDFVPLRLPRSSKIKAKNALQRCALDILNNPDITVAAILGGYGTGKSFLTMRMALDAVLSKGTQQKILGVREASGEGKSVGYLKGNFEDKTGMFFKPLEQQLEGGEYELHSLIQRGQLETNIPFYMKGTTYNSTILVVDEAEDLTKEQIRLIGTRVGENSRIFLSGDYNQSLINRTETNPLVMMCDQMKGHRSFACIYLDEDVRSETSKMFANLFR